MLGNRDLVVLWFIFRQRCWTSYKPHLLEYWPCAAYCFRRFRVGRSCIRESQIALVSRVSVVWKGLRVKPLLCLAGNNNRKIMISTYLEDQDDCPRTTTDVLMWAEVLAEMQHYSLVLSDAFASRLIWSDIVWWSNSLPCSLAFSAENTLFHVKVLVIKDPKYYWSH